MRLEIQWIDVKPGKVFIGSDNRSVLFGGIGPRHEVKIDYNFEISFLPVNYEIANVFSLGLIFLQIKLRLSVG